MTSLSASFSKISSTNQIDYELSLKLLEATLKQDLALQGFRDAHPWGFHIDHAQTLRSSTIAFENSRLERALFDFDQVFMLMGLFDQTKTQCSASSRLQVSR